MYLNYSFIQTVEPPLIEIGVERQNGDSKYFMIKQLFEFEIQY